MVVPWTLETVRNEARRITATTRVNPNERFPSVFGGVPDNADVPPGTRRIKRNNEYEKNFGIISSVDK
jgi:hypothetical protein